MTLSPVLILHCQELINNEYIKLEKCNNDFHKASYLNNILAIKIEISDNNIYKDLKDFIFYYTKSIDNRGYGYDHLEVALIFNYLHKIDYSQKLKILEYLKRCIKQHMDDPINESLCQKQINKTRMWIIIHKKRWFINPYYLLKLLFILSSRNILSLILSIFILLVIETAILSKAGNEIFAIFKLEGPLYTKHEFTNRFINLTMNALDLDNGFKITYLNVWAAILGITGKILGILIIVNFLTKELLKRLYPS